MIDSHKEKVIAGLLVLVVLGFGLWTAQMVGENQQATVLLYEGDTPYRVPVQEVFEEKIVYTTDVSLDEDMFIQDCSDREGEFNECGSVCEEDNGCVALCAYTCEF